MKNSQDTGPIASKKSKSDRGNSNTAALTLPQLAEDSLLTSTPTNSDRPFNEYAALKQLIKNRGLLNKQPGYYTYKFIMTLGLFALSVALLFIVKNFWFQLLNIILLAVASTQVGFLGHDAGHRQIFHSTRKNNIVTLLLGSLLIGMSNNWWLDKHNAHHSHPNQEGLDPDIDIALIAFTEEEARKKRSFQRFIVKYQAFFFLPLLSLVGLDLHYRSILFLFQHKNKESLIEGSLLTIHYILYLGVMFYLFNIWQAVIFIVVHQLLFGLFLGSAFAPNHKGMPILENDSRINFLRRQVLTARNVNAGLFNDFWYGGLNYQIEHHLFPSMPRNNLREAQRIVKEFCQTHSIAYYETSMLQSYRDIMGFLHRISYPLRASRS